jgi:hypothetical protein
MFHKSKASDAGDLKSAVELGNLAGDDWLPVHEGDYGHQFDHRFGTFDGRTVRAVTAEEHKNPNFEPAFELRARRTAFEDYLERWRLASPPIALLGFRRVARSTDDRTSLAAILPWMPMTYGWIVLLSLPSKQDAILCGNFNALVLDYCLRNALSQPSIPQNVYEQLPILPPSSYTPADLSDRQFREGWKEFTKLYDSGAASLTVIVTEAHMLGDPLPDPIAFLRTFDRNRGAKFATA